MDGFVGIHRNTTLDLNGPVLSVTTQPVGISTCGVATFTGIATATFPTQTPSNPAKLTGSLSYQWYYKVGSATTSGQMSNGTMVGLGLTGITGAGTTTLTVYGTSTTEPYTLEGIKFFLRPDYVPSAYGSSSPITAGTARSTGHANNEPHDSNSVDYTFYPTISITTQPAGLTTAAQTLTADFDVGATITDGTQDSSLTYQWIFNGTDLTDSSTVTGSGTSALSMSYDTVGVHTLTAKITHPTACNSPIYSNVVDFDVVSSRQIVNYELTSGDGSWYGSGSHNLFDSSRRFAASAAVMSRVLVLYAPERDIRVKMTLAAGAGRDKDRGNGNNKGGEGGVSTFWVTLEQNREYVVKLGSSVQPSGGNGGGGGGSFLYKGGTVLAVVGGGGGAGALTMGPSGHPGGHGGGVGLAGQTGGGSRPGSGGILYATGQLPLQGFFAGGGWLPPIDYSSGSPGRLSACTFGQYWTGRGYSACQDMGYVKFYSSSGNEVSQSTNSIIRGYKSGLGHRNCGGNTQRDDSGGGGAGAAGGGGATGNGSGGGGGSGYSNGEIEVISTTLGGNLGQDGYVILEL